MVSSTTRKIFSLAISLLVVVISLTGVASGANAPTGLSKLARYTPGFSGAPGKMARDAANNFYVADFWGKGIRKFDRNGANPSFIPTKGRPSAVAVLPNNRLVVAMQSPRPYVAFYSQQTGAEISEFAEGSFPALYRPAGITVDLAGYIYVVDSGDLTGDTPITSTANCGRVRVYSPAGTCLEVIGTRTYTNVTSGAEATGAFKLPLGIAYEKKNNQIVIVDTMNGRLLFYPAYSGPGTFTYAPNGKTVGALVGTGSSPTPDAAAKFYNPVDVAFEYDGAGALYRMYVAERGKHQIAVVDGVAGANFGYYRSKIDGTTVTNAAMNFPAGVLFEKTAIGGVLYTDNAPSATPADVLAIGIDSCPAIPPASTVAFTISPAVAPSTAGTNLSIGGTVAPIYAVTCSANGVNPVSITPTSNNWSLSVPGLVLDAENYILCTTSDGTATKYLEARTYAKASLVPGPTVTIAQPAAGLITKNTSVTVSGTTVPLTPNAYVKIDNTFAGFTTTIQADASGNWSTTATLAEGLNGTNNLLSVTSWAPGTTVSAPVTRPVVVDYTAPNLSNISFLRDGSTTNVTVQNLDGIVADANLNDAPIVPGSNLNTILVNGAPVAAKVALSTVNGITNTYFSVPVTLNRGLNTVTIQATDLAGNSSAVVTRTVTLDTELPAFSVTLPGDNSFMTGGSSTTANGIRDPFYTSVTVAGTPQAVPPGTWNGSFTVGAGFGSYPFVASGGTPVKTVELKRTIINGAAAQLAITTPAADIATMTSSWTIAGKVASCVPTPTISVDGGTAVPVSTCTAGSFSHPVNLGTVQTVHVVKVTAGATAAIRNIIYDTTPPDISIQADAHATPSVVAGAIEPSARISAIDATQNGAVISIPVSVITYSSAAGQSLWSANLSAYDYDEGSLAFTASDPALNTTRVVYAKGVPTGDCNGDGKVDIIDAILALRHAAHVLPLLTGIPRFQCDVGGLVGGHAAQDGDVDTTDAVLILGKSAGALSF